MRADKKKNKQNLRPLCETTSQPMQSITLNQREQVNYELNLIAVIDHETK